MISKIGPVAIKTGENVRFGILVARSQKGVTLLARLPSWLMKDAGISPSLLGRRSGHR
jgi:hypothetical protein